MITAILQPLEWIQKLGFIEQIKSKLLNRPDAAAEKLAEVFDELNKIFVAMDEELITFMSLQTEDDEKHIRTTLLRFEGAQITSRIDGGRGHCHKIWNIYTSHLNAWFQRTLNAQEQAKMEQIFSALSYSDSAMDQVMTTLSRLISKKAGTMLDLLDQDRKAEAMENAKISRQEFKILRNEMSLHMSALQNFRNQFIQKAGITG